MEEFGALRWGPKPSVKRRRTHEEVASIFTVLVSTCRLDFDQTRFLDHVYHSLRWKHGASKRRQQH